jgi:hypothetical protein
MGIKMYFAIGNLFSVDFTLWILLMSLIESMNIRCQIKYPCVVFITGKRILNKLSLVYIVVDDSGLRMLCVRSSKCVQCFG